MKHRGPTFRTAAIRRASERECSLHAASQNPPKVSAYDQRKPRLPCHVCYRAAVVWSGHDKQKEENQHFLRGHRQTACAKSLSASDDTRFAGRLVLVDQCSPSLKSFSLFAGQDNFQRFPFADQLQHSSFNSRLAHSSSRRSNSVTVASSPGRAPLI